ncbi:carbonic anhydrase [Gloeopeniophorella convolvens]|nr:carbonic anhydrase [Gloeopeniophorella convolvens]
MDSALFNLLQRNDQWSDAVEAADPNFFPDSASNVQTPAFLWIGCADSRVPPSVLTASKPGDLFVHRNVASLVHPDDENTLSVISFAVEAIKVTHILVVGHTVCGGAQACLNTALGIPIDPPPAPVLQKWLSPLIDLAHSLRPSPDPAEQLANLRRLVVENVRQQIQNVVNTETVQAAWAHGKELSVHGLLYDLATGKLEDLQLTVNNRSES